MRSQLNLANAITIGRILLIPVFLVVLLSGLPEPYADIGAAAVFILAAATDKLDGYVARRRQSITTLGQFLDPLADKLLIAAALIALVSQGRVPAWVAMVIIGREIAVSVLRVVGAFAGRVHPGRSVWQAQDGAPDHLCGLRDHADGGHRAPPASPCRLGDAHPVDPRGARRDRHAGQWRQLLSQRPRAHPHAGGIVTVTRAMPSAAIVLSGNELLDGRVRDSNGSYVSADLSDRGVKVTSLTTVADDAARLTAALRRALAEEPDLLVVGGGLGTTHDDLTAACLAEALGVPLKEDPLALAMLKVSLSDVAERRRVSVQDLLPQARRQARLPAGGTPLPPAGVAPGIAARRGRTRVFALPGGPS